MLDAHASDGTVPPVASTPAHLLDARVNVDDRRAAAHQLWSASVSVAVFGFVDPFDLVTFIADGLPRIQGCIKNDLFVVQEATFTIGAMMLSADHGSAALFTVLPGGRFDDVRLQQLFHSPWQHGNDGAACRTELVDTRAAGQDVIDIVTRGHIGDVQVFAELTA